MNMTVKPVGKKFKADVAKGLNVIANDAKYRYNLWINRRMMGKYMALCRLRRVKAPDQIAKFIERELNRYDDMVPAQDDENMPPE